MQHCRLFSSNGICYVHCRYQELSNILSINGLTNLLIRNFTHHSSMYSHPGYEIILFYYVFCYYYLYLAFHIYDSYFFFFAFIVMMRSHLFCELASKIGDFDSVYDTPQKQKKLIFQLYGLHRDITR